MGVEGGAALWESRDSKLPFVAVWSVLVGAWEERGCAEPAVKRARRHDSALDVVLLHPQSV
jgi:hypothetical protein